MVNGPGNEERRRDVLYVAGLARVGTQGKHAHALLFAELVERVEIGVEVVQEGAVVRVLARRVLRRRLQKAQ